MLAHGATRVAAVLVVVSAFLVWRFGPAARKVRERDRLTRRIEAAEHHLDETVARLEDARRHAEEARAEMLRAHRRSVETTVGATPAVGQTRRFRASCERGIADGCRWASYERLIGAATASEFADAENDAVRGCGLGDATSCWLAGDAAEYRAALHPTKPDAALENAEALRRKAVRHYQAACAMRFWFGCYSGVDLILHEARFSDLSSSALEMAERGCSLSVEACRGFCRMGMAPACDRLPPDAGSAAD
jgi:hypothetical protein